MKKIALLSLSFISLYASAQNIKLAEGKKINATTTMTMDMDMGMGGQMKIATDATNVLVITGSEAENYLATNTITKMKSSQEAGGQSSSYDSEKESDKDSEMGKAMADEINHAKPVKISKSTGKVEEIKGESGKDEEENPMEQLFGGTPGSASAGYFFIIPAGKKIGDSWIDSTNVNGMKTINQNVLKSLNNGIAVINVSGKMNGTVSKETQGMQLDITINSTSNAVMEVDTASSIVKKRTDAMDMTGNMEVMGQSMPITAKMNATTVVE